MRIRDTLFSFFDTETTGLDPYVADHRVVQAAVISIRGGEIVDTFQSLVNPERPIPPDVIPIHGIRDEMVEGAPLISDILPRLLDLLSGGYVVIHNARFDLAFLDIAIQECRLPPATLAVIDTLEIARRHMNFPRNSLRAIAGWYGIETPRRHGALDDAHMLHRVFDRIREDLRLETIDDLERLRGVQRVTVGRRPAAPDFWRRAIDRGSAVEIDYRTAGGPTRRVIVPLRYVEYSGRRYIVAFCRLREGRRVFRLDRMRVSGSQ